MHTPIDTNSSNKCSTNVLLCLWTLADKGTLQVIYRPSNKTRWRRLQFSSGQKGLFWLLGYRETVPQIFLVHWRNSKLGGIFNNPANSKGAAGEPESVVESDEWYGHRVLSSNVPQISKIIWIINRSYLSEVSSAYNRSNPTTSSWLTYQCATRRAAALSDNRERD